ncbi:MAG: hypothetical protein PWR20_1334 [Bacteroidales bacterium]|jgi:hypothetical protein|nr:hypothetical protein [Bacteroidales bacterium]MDN5329292.1 hypothetical protein [Bacteroidales bacterium]
MIQRIQTIYLLLAAIAAGVLVFLFPLAGFYGDLATLELWITGLKNLAPVESPVHLNLVLTYLGAFLSLVVAIQSIIILLQYKNRIRQLKLLRIAWLANILLVVFLFFESNLVAKGAGVSPEYKTGIFFPVISLVFLILAQRAIQSDERKVRAADRLR